MRSGRPFKPWDTRPRVAPHLRWVWNAFWELSTCRPVMSRGAIPWTAVREWSRSERVVARERFEYLIRRMDTELLDALEKSEPKTVEQDG